MNFADMPYRLGLPAWAYPGWKGQYWTDSPSTLANYSRIFHTVEGNTTFYGVPGPRSVAGWKNAVAGRNFEFCFKPPRTVTHSRPASREDLTAFLRAIEPLEQQVGPFLVQFPATVGPANVGAISAVLERLPRDRRCVVEVRHPEFFSNPARLEGLLERFRAGRVVMDTRPLYQGDRQHPEVLRAMHEKPDLPVLPAVYNNLVFLRIVLHPDPRYNQQVMLEWAQKVAGYIDEGYETYVMIHCPNNLHCPQFAQDFHALLAEQPSMAQLPAFPAWPLPMQGSLL